MKNSFVLSIVLIALCSCHSKADIPELQDVSLAFAKRHLSNQDSQHYHAAISEVLDKNLLHASFNGAILIAKNGDIVYEKYVGVKDLRLNKDSISSETPFQIASTGKTMTAAAVLRLWEESKLNLDDDVAKYFPGFPYKGVTIKTLLNHRSGLPNYLNYMEKGKWVRTKQASNADVLTTLINWKPQKAANPDKRFQYCNTNYVLLALIIEKVSGVTYPEYMKQTFFEPLGMNNSFVISANEQVNHLMSFQPNNNIWNLDFSDGPYGDKNIYSTPRDLLLWDRALYDGKVLQQATLDSAYTPYSNEKPGIRNYGLGWRMLNYPSGKKIIFHNGHWHGFNVAFSRLPDEKATIIIISNKYNQAVYSAAKKLYEVFGEYNGKEEESVEQNAEGGGGR